MGGFEKKIKSNAVFLSFFSCMSMFEFKCVACNRVVVSQHMHRVVQAYQMELSACVGRPLEINAKICCGHFASHASPRFTKKNPAILLRDFNGPKYVAQSRPPSRSVNRPETSPVRNYKSATARLKDAEKRVQELEKQVHDLQDALKIADSSIIRKLLTQWKAASPESVEKNSSLRYWTGVSSLDLLEQFCEAQNKETRGRPSKLSHLEKFALAMIFLRRGPPLKSLSLFASLSEGTISLQLDNTIDDMYRCVLFSILLAFC